MPIWSRAAPDAVLPIVDSPHIHTQTAVGPPWTSVHAEPTKAHTAARTDFPDGAAHTECRIESEDSLELSEMIIGKSCN